MPLGYFVVWAGARCFGGLDCVALPLFGVVSICGWVDCCVLVLRLLAICGGLSCFAVVVC